jgi:hypothetical protein
MRHVSEDLYDYLTGRLAEKDKNEVEAHIGQCPGCKRELEEMRGTLKILDQLTPPPLPEKWKNDMIREIRTAPLPTRTITERIKEWCDIPSSSWSLKGAGIALAVLVVFVVIYKEFSPTHQVPETQLRGGFEAKLENVKSPIILKCPDPDGAVPQLRTLIESYSGKLVRRRQVESGIEVTLSMPPDKEERVIGDLSRLGKVEIKDKGYKNSEGYLVIRLVQGS